MDAARVYEKTRRVGPDDHPGDQITHYNRLVQPLKDERGERRDT
jgi:hypothetical protein